MLSVACRRRGCCAHQGWAVVSSSQHPARPLRPVSSSSRVSVLYAHDVSSSVAGKQLSHDDRSIGVIAIRVSVA